MANYLWNRLVLQEDILIENRSRTTLKMIFNKAILEDQGLEKKCPCGDQFSTLFGLVSL